MRLNQYNRDEQSVMQIVGKMEDTLFEQIQDNKNYFINHLLPPTSDLFVQSQGEAPRQAADESKLITETLC